MKIYLYLFNIFFVMSCKLWYSSNLNDTMEKGDYTDPVVVGVKGMFESTLEVKSVNKDNLKDMAEKVRVAVTASKDKVLGSKDNKGNIALRDAPALVREIRESAEKFDKVVKSLVASGYSASEPLKDNMKIGIDRIYLLDKILDIVSKTNGSDIDFTNDGISIYNEIKKVIDEFNQTEHYSVISVNSYNTKGKDLVKKCIKELMQDVDRFLGDVKVNGDGVSGELLQSAKSESGRQFSEPLKILSEAAAAITEACKRLAYDIELK